MPKDWKKKYYMPHSPRAFFILAHIFHKMARFCNLHGKYTMLKLYYDNLY